MRIDGFRRTLNESSYEVKKKADMLKSELADGEKLATRNEIFREHKEKVNELLEKNRFAEKCFDTLREFQDTAFGDAEESDEKQKMYLNAMAEALPQISYMLDDIGNRMKSENSKLKLEKSELTLEIQQLRELVNRNIGAETVKEEIARIITQPRVDHNELLEAREKAFEEKQRANRLDGRVTELQSELHLMASSKNDAEKKVKSLCEQQDIYRKRVAAVEKKYQKKRQAYKEISEDLTYKVEANETLQKIFYEDKQKIMELEEEKRRALHEMEDLINRNTRTVADSVKTLENIVAELREKQTKLRDEKDKLGHDIVGLGLNIRTKDDEIKNLEEQRDEAEDRVKSLKDDCSRLKVDNATLSTQRESYKFRVGELNEDLKRLNDRNSELAKQSNVDRDNVARAFDLRQKTVETYHDLEVRLREQIKTAEGARDNLAQEKDVLQREKKGMISLEQHQNLLSLYDALLKQTQIAPNNSSADNSQADIQLDVGSMAQIPIDLVLRPSTNSNRSSNLESIRPAARNRLIQARRPSSSSGESTSLQSYMPTGMPQHSNGPQGPGNDRSIAPKIGRFPSVTPQNFRPSPSLSSYSSTQSWQSVSPHSFGQSTSPSPLQGYDYAPQPGFEQSEFMSYQGLGRTGFIPPPAFELSDYMSPQEAEQEDLFISAQSFGQSSSEIRDSSRNLSQSFGPPQSMTLQRSGQSSTISPMGFRQSASPSLPQGSPAIPQPGFGQPKPYQFLLSGLLEHGELTLDVDPALIVQMDKMIQRWVGQNGKCPWSSPTSASSERCVDTRRYPVTKKKNPPANEPNHSVACGKCIEKKWLCVLIGSRGPVIVPLPFIERSMTALPGSLEWYLKR